MRNIANYPVITKGLPESKHRLAKVNFERFVNHFDVGEWGSLLSSKQAKMLGFAGNGYEWPPHYDHGEFFRTKRGEVLNVFHPYALRGNDETNLLSWAASRGLKCRIYPRERDFYNPHACNLVIITPSDYDETKLANFHPGEVVDD